MWGRKQQLAFQVNSTKAFWCELITTDRLAMKALAGSRSWRVRCAGCHCSDASRMHTLSETTITWRKHEKIEQDWKQAWRWNPSRYVLAVGVPFRTWLATDNPTQQCLSQLICIDLKIKCFLNLSGNCLHWWHTLLWHNLIYWLRCSLSQKALHLLRKLPHEPSLPTINSDTVWARQYLQMD